MSWLALGLALACCGRTEPVRGLYTGVSTPGDGGTTCASTCRAPPSVADSTPFATVASGAPLHWPVCEGCVRVTLDPVLSTSLGTTRFVVNAWDITLAGGLCLSPVEFAAADPTELHRIHIVPGQERTLVTDEGGTLLRAVVGMGSSTVEQTTLFGTALGLGTSADLRNSVMSATTTRNTPGPFDQNALRALYGLPPWCER
jgi:hypothetical protein